MTISKLKLQIINKVNSISDELILEEINKLVNFESEIDTIYNLTAEEKNAIEEGLDDLKSGRVYSSEEADNLVKEWLKK